MSKIPPASTDRPVVYVASDHAAVTAKRAVLKVLADTGIETVDLGTDTAAQSVDYPDYAVKVARSVAREPHARGILLCGTGIGMAIAANKVHGIRAALVGDVTGARMSRAHNDANVLCLGGGVLGERLIADIVATWLETPFEGGRHQRRLDEIAAIEAEEAGRQTVDRGKADQEDRT